MIIDSLYHGETLLEATRAELYERGSVRDGRVYELRAERVRGLPVGDYLPRVTVRVGDDVYHGRCFADNRTDPPRLFGLVEPVGRRRTCQAGGRCGRGQA